MSGTKNTQSTMQQKDVYAPAAPHLYDIMNSASTLYNQGAGSQVWSGPNLAPLSGQTQEGLNLTTNTARNAMSTAGQPYQAAVAGTQNGGITAGMQQPMNVLSGVANGQNRINTGGMYGGLLGRSLTQNAQPNDVMGQIAQTGVMSQDNPYLKDMLDANAARVANRVNSTMSGAGRYGSYSHGDALARSIGEVNNPIMAQAYENDQNRRLQDAGLRLNAASTLAGGQRADVAGGLSALSGLTGVQQQNIGNQTGAAAGLLDNFARGQSQAQQWAALAPQLNNLQYDPANRMMAAGGLLDARAQADLDAQKALFAQQQAMPWTQLARYQGGISGLAPLMANAGATSGWGQTIKDPGFLDYAQLFMGGENSAASGMAGAGKAGLDAIPKFAKLFAGA